MTTDQIKRLIVIESAKIECKQRVMHLINRAIEKKRILSNSAYYTTFGTSIEQYDDLEAIDKVINRLVNYFLKMT